MLRIVAAMRLAFDVRKLIVAAAGILVFQLGWALLDRTFPDDAPVTPGLMMRRDVATASSSTLWPADAVERVSEPVRILIQPLSALLKPGRPWPSMLHALLAVAWVIVVWGFCGGAIARIAVVQEARSAQTGILEALRFAWRSARSLLLAPTYPLLVLFFCALMGIVLGFFYRIPGGSVVAGVLLILPLLAGVIMTLLLVALVAGWPMFHAAVASGADDALDALSRTYSYLNQRLSHFAAGVAIAGAAGLFGLILFDGLADLVIRLTRWSLSLSGPPSEIAAFFGDDASTAGKLATAPHQFWLGGVRLLVRAWSYSFFWSAAALLYVWLRKEVDGTPTDVIEPTAFTIAISEQPDVDGQDAART